MKLNYLNKPNPPICLHILGQGLVNALHVEGQELRKYFIKKLLVQYTERGADYSECIELIQQEGFILTDEERKQIFEQTNP